MNDSITVVRLEPPVRICNLIGVLNDAAKTLGFLNLYEFGRTITIHPWSEFVINHEGLEVRYPFPSHGAQSLLYKEESHESVLPRKAAFLEILVPSFPIDVESIIINATGRDGGFVGENVYRYIREVSEELKSQEGAQNLPNKQ